MSKSHNYQSSREESNPKVDWGSTWSGTDEGDLTVYVYSKETTASKDDNGYYQADGVTGVIVEDSFQVKPNN